MTTTEPATKPTAEDYARRTAIAAETLAKVAVGWSYAAVIAIFLGICAWVAVLHG